MGFNDSFFVALYDDVQTEEKKRFRVNDNDVRVGIRNMKEVYKPADHDWSKSAILNVADYNEASHRCAYMHKYAGCHTGLVHEMLQWAIKGNVRVFASMFQRTDRINLCCLGGGPGNDLVAFATAFAAFFKFFQNQLAANVVDISPGWENTFYIIIKLLQAPKFERQLVLAEDTFHYSYIQANMVGPMDPSVHQAVSSADFLTMIKFISAAACDSTRSMVRKVFNSMKPGAMILFIDNAAGGFHELVAGEARDCKFKSIYGPHRHVQYKNDIFSITKYGYTSLSETRITVEIWRKKFQGNLNPVVTRDDNRSLEAFLQMYRSGTEGTWEMPRQVLAESNMQNIRVWGLQQPSSIIPDRRNQIVKDEEEETEPSCCVIM